MAAKEERGTLRQPQPAIKLFLPALFVVLLLVQMAAAAEGARYLRLIAVRSRAEAEELRAAFQRGEPFEKLAQQHSIDPSAERGGYLGFVWLDRLNDSFRRAAAPLRPGQVSPPFQPRLEWVLLYRMKRDFHERVTRLQEQGDAFLEQDQLEGARDSYLQALLLFPDFPQGHFSLGVVYGLLNQPDLEEKSYRRALQLAPDFAQAHYNLGKLYAAEGDPYSALHAFQKAIEAKPDYAEAHVNLAALQLATGDQQAALASAGRAVEINPLLASAHYNLGLARASSDLEGALQSFRLAATLSPSQLDARVNAAVALARLDRMEEARSELEDLLELHADYEPARNLLRQLQEMEQNRSAPETPRGSPGPNSANLSPDAQKAREQALEWMSRGEFEQAGDLLERAGAQSPQDASLRGLAAQARAAAGARLYAQGRLDSANLQWRRALQLQPEYVPALLGLARSAIRQGTFPEAANLLDRAARQRPDSPAVVLTKAELAYERRDFETSYGLLRQLQPSRLEVPHVLQLVALLLDLELTSEALEIAREAVPQGEPLLQLSHLLTENALYEEAEGLLRDQNSPEARLQLAHVFLRQLRFGESEPLLEQLLVSGYRPWQTRMLLGKLYLDSGRAERAVPVMEQAVELEPENINGIQQLALCYWQAGDRDSAIAWLRRGLKIETQSDSLQYELGRMLSQSGERVEALGLLLGVVGRQPDHPRAHYVLGDLYRQLGDLAASRRHLERFRELQESLEKDRRELKARKAALKTRTEGQP